MRILKSRMIYDGRVVKLRVDRSKDPSAEACQDEQAMAADYKKTLGDLVTTVKNENLPAFERAFHRKNCLAKLGFVSMS